MPYQSTAVIARSAGAPAEVVTISVPDPGPGEAVVRIAACGICRTDRHYRDGLIGDAFPYLLGHEAAGTVAAVGAGVTEVAAGDYVVLNWRAVCGQCRSCRRGQGQYCRATRNAEQQMIVATGPDAGRKLTPSLGIGGFTEYTLVAAGQCTRIDPAVPATVAGLIGCGITTGVGAAIHAAPVRPGDAVAVIGCGTVGCAAVLGAKMAGATQIIAVGRNADRLALATRLGATATVDARAGEVAEAIRQQTGGRGADVVIDAVGTTQTWRQAFDARDLAGTGVLVGLPAAAELLPDIPLAEVFGRGGAMKVSWYGDCLPARDFPLLADLYRAGRLPLDLFVSGTVGLDGAEGALAGMDGASGLRTVVLMPSSSAAASR